MNRPKEWYNLVLLFIVSLIFAADLFLHAGRPVTFDGPTHLTTMAQFATGLMQGQLPVSWADGFGNYGMPIPVIAQQTTSYMGAIFYLLVKNIFIAYNLTVLTGAFLSVVAVYYCLRYWYSEESSLAGSLLFMFAPYRMMNVFIRGDIPEFFVSLFLPLTILGFLYSLQKRKWWGLLLIVIGVSGIFLTHPIMTVPLGLILGPVWLVLAYQEKRNWRVILATLIAGLLGAFVSAYYLFPLFGEIKYFNYGTGTAHLIDDQYLSVQNYFQPAWYYFYKNDIGPRAQYIQMGSLEGVVYLLACAYAIFTLFKPDRKTKFPLYIGVVLGAAAIFLTLPQSHLLYTYFLPLNNIQHPWRMLTALLFIPPFLLSDLMDRTLRSLRYRKGILVLVVLFIVVYRLPQTYGKNYLSYPESMYFYTITNLHGTNLNTVWTGNTRDYPVKSLKYEVIEGVGKVSNAQVTNGLRHYTVESSQAIRMADYTFYFPGWELKVDGQVTPIEFQDPNYRGIITYHLEPGKHNVDLVFKDTTVRKLSKIITLLAVFVTAVGLWSVQKWPWLLETPSVKRSKKK